MAELYIRELRIEERRTYHKFFDNHSYTYVPREVFNKHELELILAVISKSFIGSVFQHKLHRENTKTYRNQSLSCLYTFFTL